jgi:hypothetical protein
MISTSATIRRDPARLDPTDPQQPPMPPLGPPTDRWVPPAPRGTPPPDGSGSGPDRVSAGVPPTRGARRLRVGVAGGLAVALLLGGGAAAAFLRMRGAPEQILGEIPASTDAVVVAYLDPAASQKLNLVRLQGRFPSLASSQHLRDQVNAGLDAALRESGLDHRDVAWVGSEIAIAVDIRPQGDPGVAVLLSVDDAGAADATLEKLRAEPVSTPSSWTRVTQRRCGRMVRHRGLGLGSGHGHGRVRRRALELEVDDRGRH